MQREWAELLKAEQEPNISEEQRAEIGHRTMQVLFELSGRGDLDAPWKLRERWTVIDGGEPENS